MDCNKEEHRMAELINLRTTGNPRAGRCFVVAPANNGQREIESVHYDRKNDPISGTLHALDRRLEAIRKEQLAKNRSSLRQLDSQQLQAVEWVTTNITRKIFREVADELEHSASEGNGKRLSETVWLMLGLA
jgi:glutamyl-tRNA reductase